MDRLNDKVKAGRSQTYQDAQVVGITGLDQDNNLMRAIDSTTSGELKVAVSSHLVDSPDMKARTTITDPATSTFLKCNPDGTLEMTAELDSSALAKEVTLTDGTQKARCMGGETDGTQQQLLVSNSGVLQVLDSEVFGKTSQIANQTTLSNVNEATIIANQTNGTQKATVGNTVGDGSGTAKHLLTNANGELLVNLGSATTQNVNCLGNESGDGTGTARHLHLDGSGNVLSVVSNTVNVAPANSVNSHITDDPANSVAVGLKARTTIGTATTETFLKCDASGVLQVNDTSGGGGGGSATNTYDSTAVSVLAPPGAAPLITATQRFDLTSVKQINGITLWTVATNFTDVSKVGLEYSYDGTNYFSDLSSASSPSWTTTTDLTGNTRTNPAGGVNPIYIDQSLFPDQDKARYFRIVFEHSNSGGANVEIIPIIVFGGI